LLLKQKKILLFNVLLISRFNRATSKISN
jgi:hypothetical protein